MHFDHIIIASDLSDNSGAAARWVSSAKQALGAKVVVAHIIEVSVKTWFSSAFDLLEENGAERDKAEENIRCWYKDMAGENPDIVALRGGGVLHQLTDLATELGGKNLVVMAASGRGAVNKFILGSNARSVASAPPCPLVIVHPDHDSISSSMPVVVGTDFSENADKAIRLAVEFCTLTHAKLEIVHANPLPPMVIFDGGDVPLGSLEKSVTEWSHEQMNQLLERHTELSELEVETIISPLPPSDALAEYASTNDSNLVVVGHSGESELMQNVLGSVAQRTLNRMPCTLIIVPHA